MIYILRNSSDDDDLCSSCAVITAKRSLVAFPIIAMPSRDTCESFCGNGFASLSLSLSVQVGVFQWKASALIRFNSNLKDDPQPIPNHEPQSDRDYGEILRGEEQFGANSSRVNGRWVTSEIGGLFSFDIVCSGRFGASLKADLNGELIELHFSSVNAFVLCKIYIILFSFFL